MARRPLPRILSSGTTRLAQGREMARTAADNATDVLHPLITVSRGLRLLAVSARQKWAGTPRERRGPALFLVAACVLVVALMPYGPLLALVTVMALAAWKGNGRAPRRTGPDEAEVLRLQSLYEALVPYFSVPEDPSPLFAHGGAWSSAFAEHEFDDQGRLTRLEVTYPPYFTDGDAVARTTVERLLHAKSGRGREYHFDWKQEDNRLVMSVLPALSTSIVAQRFVTVPGETVLGFTDDASVRRTVPVLADGETLQKPPVLWRTGPRSTEPNLLIVGRPGAGSTTLLRSITLQALQHGDVVVVEGSGTGEFACFAERPGVLAVESALSGALAALEWASHETERRLIAANRARQSGTPLPEDVKRPLWILVDRPSVFAHLAAADGRRDPQQLLTVPLRHGRAAGVTVVVADHADALSWIDESVTSHTPARVVLGALPAELVESVLGAPPHTTPTPDVPPGRGYARLGASCEVLRVQVPATPDPYDEAATDAGRQAVLALLPQRRDAPQEQEQEQEPEQGPERGGDQGRGRGQEARAEDAENLAGTESGSASASEAARGTLFTPATTGSSQAVSASEAPGGSARDTEPESAPDTESLPVVAPVAPTARASGLVRPAAAPVAAEG
ncbi:hypothetical protein [Streptomyces sp. NBC_01497]|uniref:hypothetical protein n=1 Tax=Streptomyces sp. NBC_01497 TaxID=2903885 RepID=UPI002E2F5A71|nr:hypothetical protein [Streptomyces sp. NBC_01497]